MSNEPFRRDNHYVSSGYLKRWALSNERIWTYRTLVRHSKVPMWRLKSPRGVAYHSHLYTRVVAGEDSDEIEKWLEREFETPAEEALQKATSDARLTPDDWKRLVRFLAAQDVRTPAWFEERMKHWEADLPSLIKEAVENAVREAEDDARSNRPLPTADPLDRDGIPFRVITKHDPGQEMGQIGVEMVVGRGLWLWSIRRALTERVKALHKHRWTVLSPPRGVAWFTTDNPVVRLNFKSVNDYTFSGGWGSPGTEIYLPLGPQHLMFTQIGRPTPRRGERMSQPNADLVKRMMAEHAYRFVFAGEQDADVVRFRPRRVDAALLRREQEQWASWHDQQTSAERELYLSPKTD